MKPTLKKVFWNIMAYTILGMAWFIVVHETSIIPFPYDDYTFIALSAVFWYLVGRRDLLAIEHYEEGLRKSEEKYRTLAEAAQDAIYIINREDRVEYVNNFGAGLLGLKPEKVIGRKLETFFPPDESARQKEHLEKVFETGQPLYAEDRIHFLESEIWMHTSLVPMRNEAGYVIAVMGGSRDITVMKRAEEELRLLQEMTRDIAESEDFFSALDISLRKVCKTTGWIYGETWVPSPDNSYIRLTPPWYSGIEGLEEFREASEAFKFHKDVGIPGRVWSSKKPLWVRDVSADKNLPRAPLASKSGLRACMGIPILAGEEVVAVLVFFVTEAREEDERFIALISAITSQLGTLFRRKMAEQALKESERKLRLIAENATDVIFAYDMDRSLIYVNPAVKQLTGYTVDELKERNYINWVHPDDAERVKRLWNGLFEGKGFSGEEIRIVTKDGQIKWSLSSWSPMYNGGSRQIGVQGIEHDITERKRIEDELRLLQTLLQDITISKDFNSAIEVTLQKICETTGWVFGEAWLPTQDKSYLECSPVWYSRLDRLNNFRKISEGFAFRPGIGLPGRVWSSRQPAWVIDVTMDPNFPRAPYAREAGLKAAMAIPVLAGDEVVAVLDFFVPEPRNEDKRLVGLVSTVAAYLGILFLRKRMEEELYKSEERYCSLISNIPDVLWTADSKGNTVFISPNVEKMYGYIPEEIYRDPYGLWFGRIHPDDVGPVRESFELLFSKNKEFDVEYRIQRKDGEWIWLHDRAIRTYTKNGVMCTDGIFSDITEHRKLEDQLRHSQKLEAIGQLVGGIAHDFNNMLTAIIGFAGILRMKMKKDDPLTVNVEQIIEAAERGVSMTQSLLVFGRKQAIHLMSVNLSEIIEKVDRLLSRLIGEDIELRVMTAKKGLAVMADTVQIEQVLINLATNARDAMPDGGTLTIETDRENVDKEFVNVHGYGEPGEYAVISVSDTGVGMDEETKRRIFEPFFTTKEVGKGTGLGLSIVYGIVKQHNGYINVYSEVGKGTTFRIYLPLVKRKAEEKKAPEAPAPIVGSETVLVAEDDATVRKLSKTLLETFGYKVIEAVDGEDAVQKFTENKDMIHLLILDVMMPRKNGMEAYNRIREMSPNIKVLFMSGYTAEVIKARRMVGEGMEFVSKPISPTEFLKKVREVLVK